MSRPWMPLYIADYLADTAHLNATESGAYLHLIMHYWQHRGLPSDDKKLAQIAKVSTHSWKKFSHVLRKYFYDDWRHKRIEEELKKADETSQKRREAAGIRHSKGDANGPAFAMQMHTPPPPPSDPKKEREEGGGERVGGSLISDDARNIADTITTLCNVDREHPAWCGLAGRIMQWLANGWDAEADIIVGVKQSLASNGGAPGSFNYFEKAISRAHARRVAAVPTTDASEVRRYERSNVTPIAAAFDRIIERCEGVGDTAPTPQSRLREA